MLIILIPELKYVLERELLLRIWSIFAGFVDVFFSLVNAFKIVGILVIGLVSCVYARHS